MMVFDDVFLKIRESVDIYTSDIGGGVSFVQFYFINTRRKIGIEIDSKFCKLLAKVDGKTSLFDVFASCDIAVDEEAFEVVQFLLDSKIFASVSGKDDTDISSRYARQVTFLDDWIQDIDGAVAQRRLHDSHCVIFGAGAIGASIAIQLVRSGVSKLAIVDYKKLAISSQERHPYFSIDRVGDFKVDVLSDYLHEINKDCEITVYRDRILPNTDLSDFISDNTTFAVNSADEPYIGHISIKLGRYLWPKNIPLYVAGGFDAHLMSTGDFLIPGESSCVDCCSNHFSEALKDWKPSYKVHDTQVVSGRVVGGSGGLFPMSLFSAAHASLLIKNYLAGGNAYKNTINKRGEFLPNNGGIIWTEIMKREGCNVCS